MKGNRNSYSQSFNGLTFHKFNKTYSLNEQNRLSQNLNEVILSSNFLQNRIQPIQKIKNKDQNNKENELFFASDIMLKNKKSKAKITGSQNELKKKKWATTLLQPLNISRGKDLRSVVSNGSHQRSIGSRRFNKCKKRSQTKSKSNKSRKSQRSKKSLRSNKSLRSSRSQKSFPKNLYDKYGTNQFSNGQEFNINNELEQLMCKTQRQESISKKRTQSTQNVGIKKYGGHKKSLSVFSQEHYPQSVFSAGSKSSKHKYRLDSVKQSTKKKISAKMIGSVSKKLISFKPSPLQMVQAESKNYLEQFEQFRKFQKYQQDLCEKKLQKKVAKSLGKKKKSIKKLRINQNLLKTFDQQITLPKTLKQMRKNIQRNSKEQLSSRHDSSNFNNKSINLQLLSEERKKTEESATRKQSGPNQNSRSMMIDLNQLQAELEENIDDSLQKQKQRDINRFSNNLDMNNEAFTSQIEIQQNHHKSSRGSNQLYTKINTKLKHKANVQHQRYNSHMQGSKIEVLNNSKMMKLNGGGIGHKDNLVEFASKSSIFNESGKHGDCGSSQYNNTNKSNTNTRKKNNYVQHTFGKAEQQNSSIPDYEKDEERNFTGSPVSALPLACGFVQQQCMAPVNECILPENRKSQIPISQKPKLHNSFQGKHFQSSDMENLKPTKSKTSSRYLDVLENFNEIEKRNSEIASQPKRKPTKGIQFYLRKDCKYQVKSRPKKVTNLSQQVGDSLCQISEIAGIHGRSTSMFKTENSQLQISIDQDFQHRSSKSQSNLQFQGDMFQSKDVGTSNHPSSNGHVSISRGNLDMSGDLLEPSGDNDEPIFDLVGCLPACQPRKSKGINRLNDTNNNNLSTDSSQMLNQSRREKAAKRKQEILRRYINNKKDEKYCNPKSACSNIFNQTQTLNRERNLSRGLVNASLVDNYSIDQHQNSRANHGHHNRTSSLTVQDIQGIHDSRINIGSAGSGYQNQNLNTSTNNFGVRTGEKQNHQLYSINQLQIAQPQNLIHQQNKKDSEVNLQQYKSAATETRNNNLFDKIVQNAKQIPNMFDRQMIQNNFFNLQTNEIQIYSQHGSVNTNKDIHSPFVDIYKVTPIMTGGTLEKTAKQHQWKKKSLNKKTLNGMEMETPVISPCIISPVNPFVNPTSEKAVSEFKTAEIFEQNQNQVANISDGSKIMISAETGKFDQNNSEDIQKHQKSQQESKRNLNQEHYQHLLNIMLNLHMVEKHKNDYLNCPSVFLPDCRNKKVLILDVDETLIHTIDERDPPGMKGKFELLIPECNGQNNSQKIMIKVNTRPYLKESLIQLKEYYQIIAFTASEESYANAILDFIDPKDCIFDLRLYRQHCINTEYGHIKDLRVIKNRMLKDILVLDNNCLSFAFNINNGVPILPFYDNDQDEELKHLTFYLSCIFDQNVEDVREHNQEAFGLFKLRENHLNDKNNRKTELEQFLIDEKQITGQTFDKRISTHGNQTTSQNSFQNSHHMASREYLQCEPVEIDEASFHLPPGGSNQLIKNDHTFYPSGANDIEINELEMKNESFYEHIDYDEYEQSDYGNRNDYIEVIEERPSEEDYTSMKKNTCPDRYEIRN